MSKISTIWNAISDRLETITGINQPLGSIINDDFKPDVLSKDFPSFPAAIITTPSFTSNIDDSQTVMRMYEFQILVVMNGENDVSAMSVAELGETITDILDDDPTLKGKDDQSVVVFTEPAMSQALTLNTTDKTYIVFTITVKAQMLATLTY